MNLDPDWHEKYTALATSTGSPGPSGVSKKGLSGDTPSNNGVQIAFTATEFTVISFLRHDLANERKKVSVAE